MTSNQSAKHAEGAVGTPEAPAPARCESRARQSHGGSVSLPQNTVMKKTFA